MSRIGQVLKSSASEGSKIWNTQSSRCAAARKVLKKETELSKGRVRTYI